MKTKENIKNLRKSKALTQKELADALGVTKTTISNWETGTVDPTGKALSALADYFGVTTDFITGLNVDSEEHADRVLLIDRIMEADDKTVERMMKYYELITDIRRDHE